MRILNINPFFPSPPRRGMDVISLNLLRLQAERHEVTFLSLELSGREYDGIRALDGLCERVLIEGLPSRQSASTRLIYACAYRGLSRWSGRPVCTFYNTPRTLRRRVRELTANGSFDLIEVHHSTCSSLVREIGGGPRVLYMYDLHFEALRRMAETEEGRARARLLAESARFRRYELGFASEFDLVLTGQEADRAILKSLLGGRVAVEVMPNPLDMSSFVTRDVTPDVPTVVFTGAMTHAPNRDAVQAFCRECWSGIRARVPAAELFIVGSAPTKAISDLDGRDGIHVAADVPDVRPFLGMAAVVIAPLRFGSGIKVKVMEALAMGAAVVGSRVALEGMGLSDGVNVRTCDLGPPMVEAIVGLLADSAFRGRLGKQARAFAEHEFGFEHCRAQLDRLYAGVVGPTA